MEIVGLRDFSSEVPGRSSFLSSACGIGLASQVGVANRVFVTPIWVPWDCLIDELIARCQTASAGKSFRIGLYADSGVPTTPLGSALLVDSGDIPAVVGPIRLSIPAGLYVKRGVVWFTLATEDAIMAFLRTNANAVVVAGLTGMLDSCRYDLGGWGALTNPCPVLTRTTSAKLTCFVHVKNYWSK